MPEPFSEGNVVSKERVIKIASSYFDPGVCPVPREGYSYGDNPYKKYKGELFFPSEEIEFFAINNQLQESDLFPGSWIRFLTKSGSIYTIHVMENPDEEGSIVGTGNVDRTYDREGFFVGSLGFPKLGEPVKFKEYVSIDTVEDVEKVKYLDPQELKARIENKVRLLFEEKGDEWLHSSVSGIEISPHGEELKEIVTTKVIGIELGS